MLFRILVIVAFIMSVAKSSDDMLAAAQSFVDRFNNEYTAKHFAFEEQFWGTKMALENRGEVIFSAENLSKTKKDMEDLLSDPEVLQRAKDFRGMIPIADATSDLIKTLDIIIRTCSCYYMSPEGKAIREETGKLESLLGLARNQMKLGYTLPDGTFHQLSSVGLRNLLSTSSDETTRRAAYEGLRSIGPFVCDNGFVEIVKLRNRLAKLLGFVDYYDYKVQNSEGFSKDRLFEILDGLEEGTRPLMKEARQELERRFGKEATKPWNINFLMSGSVIKRMDPYFPFAKSVERYLRSYAALGIKYEGATLNLDLLDRQNKYSNGFCHWPTPSWIQPGGIWQPSVANFTSLADPKAVGSGLVALRTLMHEAGHAAHVANIKQPSPLFSQERAPSSVSYMENQSMLLDSLVEDPAWRAKYSRDVNGNPLPFEIIEEEIRATHPFRVFQIRAKLSVSYFEKALYELPDESLSSQSIQALADEIEVQTQGQLTSRPLLSVPHIISDEASCYYQGYTLAEMSVHQTRDFFFQRDGYIVDNPKVGPTLAKGYWEWGNSRPFLELVKDLTGKELSGDSLTNVLKEPVEDLLVRAKREYDDATSTCSSTEDSALDLDMVVRFVDGDYLISDSSTSSLGLLGACKEFENFVTTRAEVSL